MLKRIMLFLLAACLPLAAPALLLPFRTVAGAEEAP